MDRDVLRKTESQPVLQLLPDVNVIKIGGQSILDRGRTALLPLVEELGQTLARHKMIVSVGEGTRARPRLRYRHRPRPADRRPVDHGRRALTNQNALILTSIMMKYGAVRVPEDHFDMFPMFLNSHCPIVISGMAPYRWWEQPPEIGHVPTHRSDAGTFLTAEAFGCRSVLFVKDVDGLYAEDPKKNPNAEFIPRISVGELIERGFSDLPLEPTVIEMLRSARVIKQVQLSQRPGARATSPVPWMASRSARSSPPSNPAGGRGRLDRPPAPARTLSVPLCHNSRAS